MNLRGIAQNLPRLFGDRELHLNVLRECLLDNVFKVLEQMFRVNFDPFTLDAARKGKHLPHDIRSPLGAHFNRIEDSLCLRMVGDSLQDVDGHHDRGENVVQIMGDAAR